VPSALQSSGMSSIAVIFGTVFIAYVMIGIDEIAVEIEEPFRLLPLNQVFFF
jgi:predicted membrane chloride channel (bestrophin family)